jgi:PAS domain S-box-containing protein
MALAHEITEQVVARKIVEEREHKFRTLIEESSVASGYYLGPDIKVQYANDIMLGYFGKGKSILGKPMREVLPEIESQPFLGLLNAVYTTGEPYIGVEEKADLIVDGKLQTFYFNYTYKALRNIDNQIYGIHHIAFDVTSQVMAKRALVEIEKNLRNTILHAPVAMCIYRGPTFVVEVANNRMLELWGKTAEAVIDKPMFVGLPEAKDQGFEELIEKVYKTGVSYSASNVPVTLPRNGSIEVVYVNFIYQAYREVDGAISGIIAVATDVTEQYIARQQIEEKVTERTQELAITNHNLQKSNAELAQFAYIASHDLQEPIRKIANFSYMLEQSLGDIDLKSKNYLEKINTSTSRMLNLIRDVLSYSQLSKEGSVFEKVDLNIIIEHIKSDFDLMIEQKEAVVECSALPIVDAIPLQMTQLFSNLLSNALKFINSEVKPIITITASVLSKEEIGLNKLLNLNTVYHKIEFRDNGIGIEEKHAKKIFNIFQRLHVQADYKGTGIGLAMCKKIAQNHHGDIYITSSSFKKETIFSVILPETINVLN